MKQEYVILEKHCNVCKNYYYNKKTRWHCLLEHKQTHECLSNYKHFKLDIKNETRIKLALNNKWIKENEVKRKMGLKERGKSFKTIKTRYHRCPVCNRHTFTFFGSTKLWICSAKDCNYTNKMGPEIIEPHLVFGEGTLKAEAPVEKEHTSEKIKRQIENIIERRKRFLKEVRSFIEKRKDIFKEYKLDPGFIRYILAKEKMIKKIQKNGTYVPIKDAKEINVFLHSYYFKRYMIYEKHVYGFLAPKWVKVRKALELVLTYGESYCISIYQKQLEDLTKCQLDEYNINPCNCICEKCGAENMISANFCGQCGEKIN